MIKHIFSRIPPLIAVDIMLNKTVLKYIFPNNYDWYENVTIWQGVGQYLTVMSIMSVGTYFCYNFFNFIVSTAALPFGKHILILIIKWQDSRLSITPIYIISHVMMRTKEFSACSDFDVQ